MPGKPNHLHEGNRRALKDIGGLISKGRQSRLLAMMRPPQAPAEQQDGPDEDDLLTRAAAMRGGG